jgi:Domain of unknown function (DUF6265)
MRSAFAFITCLLLAAPVCAAEDPLQRLAWLAGCWRAEGAEAGSGEQWLAPAGGTLLGVSRTVKSGTTVAHEFMQIRRNAEGNVVYVAQPSGQAEASFTLQAGAAAEAVFENPQHDFPQRVIYRLEDGGRLRARIEGLRNGQLRGIDFPLQRVPCETPPTRPEAFQGLAWGADEAQLLQRFGAGLKPVDCGEPPRRPAPRRGEACNHPMLPGYEVAGVPFRLNLHVDERLRQLVRVSLAWEGAVAAGSDSGFSEKHRQLRQLLSLRYGSPESTHVANEPDAWNASARWRRGDTVIELNSVFRPRNAAGPARETVEITYAPVTAGDAGKL